MGNGVGLHATTVDKLTDIGGKQSSRVYLQISEVEQAEGEMQMIERARTKKLEGKMHRVYAKKGNYS